MAFTDPGDAGDDQGGGAGGPPPPDPNAGGGAAAPPGGPPQGGGPILAALANRQRGPQVSAPGPGDQSNSMQMIMQAIGMLQQALPGLPPGSPVHKDTIQSIQRVSRHLPQGAPTAGVQRTHLQDMMQNLVKNALLQRIMGQQKGQPGGGQGGGNAPMPSTPLPGS